MIQSAPSVSWTQLPSDYLSDCHRHLAHHPCVWQPFWPSSMVSTSSVVGLGSIPHFHRGSISWSSHNGDLTTGTPVATLPDAWCSRVSTGAGWPSVSTVNLWLGEIESLINNFYLGVAAYTTDWADFFWDTWACRSGAELPTNNYQVIRSRPSWCMTAWDNASQETAVGALCTGHQGPLLQTTGWNQRNKQLEYGNTDRDMSTCAPHVLPCPGQPVLCFE